MRLNCLPILVLTLTALQSCRESRTATPGSAQSAPVTQPATGRELPAPPTAADSGTRSPNGENRGQESRSRRRSAPSGDRNAARGEAGDFDFYVLSLSWSPQHCSTSAGEHDRDQCGGSKQYNFVVHGLWPQYDPRGWPQSCGEQTRVSPSLIRDMLPLMPSPKLINHEWGKHGTCSGLGQEGYFAKVKEARAKVKIPAVYQSPSNAITTSSNAIKANFVAANPGLNQNAIAVTCSGRFLQEVDVCLTKDLGLRSCGSGVRQSCPSEIIIQPIR